MECAVCRASIADAPPPRQPCCGLRVCPSCAARFDGCPVCTSDVRARTKLHDYAAAGDARKVRKHLGRGAVVEKRDERGWTPLHFASKAGHAECVRLLLAADAEPDAADDSGWTPLMEAAYGGSSSVVRRLLELGAGHAVVGAAGPFEGRTALEVAEAAGQGAAAAVLREWAAAHP